MRERDENIFRKTSVLRIVADVDTPELTERERRFVIRDFDLNRSYDFKKHVESTNSVLQPSSIRLTMISLSSDKIIATKSSKSPYIIPVT